jgi:glycosyltransferase involved in cell wall biosynthesis
VSDPRPAALVTNVVTEYRHGAFELLAEREDVEVIAWGDTGQLDAARRVASGRYRAVICGLGGRVALPAVYLAARRARIPFILWASIWSHPRTAAHALSVLPLRWIYRHADAIVTYGPHVSDYVAARRGTRERLFEAPQAVSADLFGQQISPELRAHARRHAGGGDGFFLLFVGRLEREKGVEVLLDAWRRAGLGEDATLALAGTGPLVQSAEDAGPDVHALGFVPYDHLPSLYAAADALVLPSVPTATFKEPWGLVVNEAMHQSTPVIATNAVGAAAGGLVQDGVNGVVVPAGDPDRLADAIRTLANDTPLRERLGAGAREAVAPHTYSAWADGMTRALAGVRASRKDRSC